MLCTLYKFFEELENPVVDDVNVLSTESVGKKFCWRIDNSTWIGLLSQIKTDGKRGYGGLILNKDYPQVLWRMGVDGVEMLKETIPY